MRRQALVAPWASGGAFFLPMLADAVPGVHPFSLVIVADSDGSGINGPDHLLPGFGERCIREAVLFFD